MRVATSWTRWDELFGSAPGLNNSPRNIAYSLNTDSVTSTVAPQLSTSENAIRTLANAPGFRLTAGNLVATANSRVVTAPLILEYGLTSRLTIGAVVPLVETRSTTFGQLNPQLGAANVGPNPGLTNPQLRASELQLVSSFRAAAVALQQRLTQCQTATPPPPDCTALLAQQTTALSLIQSTGVTTGAIETLYGTDAAHPGQLFVPLAAGATEAAIESRITTMIAAYQSLLPTAVISGAIAGAGGPGARDEMQLLLAIAGRDSLRQIDRTAIGDVSLGATFQVLNTFHDTTRTGPQARLAVHGEFRFGTGEPANRNEYFDIGTGYGQPGIEVGAAGDALFGRHFAATLLASYTAQMGSVSVPRVANPFNLLLPITAGVPGTYSAGNVLALNVIPRWRVAGYFVINGQYSLTNVGADSYSPATTVAASAPLGAASTTTQALGFGFSYSTVGIGNPVPRVMPFEVTFSHLETLTGTGGPVPKAFRDQVTLRVFVGR